MPRRTLGSALAFAVLVTGAPMAADHGDLADDERQALLDATLLQFLMFRFWEDTGRSCGEDLTENGRVSARTLARRMGAPYQTRLPLRDPWGNAFDIECGDGEFVVLSPGPNGGYEHEYSRDDEYRDREDPASDDLLKINDRVVQGPVPPIQRARRTMADLRSIGTAFEEFAIDNDAYPAPTPGLVPLSMVEADLEPIYIRTAPLTDGWGNEILVWSTGTRYLLLSRGADGVLDFDAERVMVDGLTAGLGGGLRDLAADLVFADGQFIQWWEPTIGP